MINSRLFVACLIGALPPLVLLTNPVQPAAAAPMTVLPSGHPVAEVGINGAGPFRFVIDTAASNTSVLPQLRRTMRGSMPKTGSQSLSGAAGETRIETLTLDRVDVDGRTVRSLKAFSLPEGPVDKLGVDGVLGADIIADYAVEMDMPGGNWRMADSVSPAMVAGMHKPVPFTLDTARAPRLIVTVDGVAIPAILDTGARGTIMNWAAARRLGLTEDSPGLGRAGAIKGVTQHSTPTRTNVFGELRLGEAKVAKPEMRIADLPVFEVLGMNTGPAIIVGIDMLADRRFVIDHPGRQLFISRNQAS